MVWSDFLVPPLFSLNFVPLLVFLLCRVFLAPSPCQRGGTLGLLGGRGRWREATPGTLQDDFPCLQSSQLPDPTLLGSDSPGSWSSEHTAHPRLGAQQT